MEIFQILLNGVFLGGLYAILAIGMSLVFGIMRLTNLAHGDLVILSTYLCMTIGAVTGNIIIALIVSIGCMMIFGFLIQNVLVNRVMGTGPTAPLLVTFGVSIILANVLLQVFGANSQTIYNSLSTSNVFTSELISISSLYLLDFVVAVVVIVALNLLMKRTFLGRAIRATSDNPTAAELMGIGTKKMYSIAMVIAMVVAAIAGLLLGMTYVFYPSTGTSYLITAFGVVVIGGMGNLMGTLVGGLVLGIAQLLGGYFFGPTYQLVTGYIVLLVILTIKPNGLLAGAARK